MSSIPLPSWAYDICWLDCPLPGHQIIWGGLEICLCEFHEGFLESGRWGNSYDGAPLPPDSRAAAWPWRDIAQAA